MRSERIRGRVFLVFSIGVAVVFTVEGAGFYWIDVAEDSRALWQTVIVGGCATAATFGILTLLFWMYLGRVERSVQESERSLAREIELRRNNERCLEAKEAELRKQVAQRRAVETQLAAQVEELTTARRAALNMTEDLRCENAERRQAEQRLAKITEAAQDAIIMIDERGDITLWNAAAERIFGYPAEEALDRDAHELLAPKHLRKKFHESFPQFQRTGKGQAIGSTIEVEALRKNGEQFPLEMSLSALQIQGRWHAVALVRDITARKQAEDAIHRAHAELDQIFNAAPPMAVLALDRSILRMNDQCAEFLEVEKNEVVGQFCYDVLPGSSCHSPECCLNKTSRGLASEGQQVKLVGKRQVPCIVRSSPYRDGTGKIAGCVQSITDISDIQQRKAEVERLHQQLVETSRRAGMSEVATGVLHNVGNVLNSVNVSANLAIDKLRASQSSGVSKVAGLLEQHADHLTEFIAEDDRGKRLPKYLRTLEQHIADERNDLIGEMSILLECVDHIKEIVGMQQAHAIVSGTRESLRADELLESALKLNEASFVRHNVQVIRDYGYVDSLTTDKHRLLQVLVNLVSNAKHALKAADDADRRLTLRVDKVEPDQVCIEIRDNGVGIAPENMERIFEHGFTTKKNGHGFGLHSSALAAKEIGGSLTAHSDGPGRGACFRLMLPIHVEKEIPCPA